PNVYFDEENRRHLNTIRRAELDLAFDLINKNKKDSAKNVLERLDRNMLQQNFPYGMVSRGNEHNQLSLAIMQAAYLADDKALGDRVGKSVKTDLQQQMKYYNSLSGWRADNLQYEKQSADDMLKRLDQMQQMFGEKNKSQELQNIIKDKVDSGDTVKPPT